MLRFQPDTWLLGLLRPLVMADPVAGIYFELPAPDMRWTALLLLLPLAWWWGGLKRWPTPQAWRLPAALLLTMYLWTFVIGNGRYFIAGLLVIGPLLLWAVREMKATPEFRAITAGLLLVVQTGMVWNSYNPGQWSIAEWRSGTGLPMPPHPLREQPAVFVTLTPISHSVLVPQFHPQSRWSNIAGQRDLIPGTPEFDRLRAMLSAPLPRYAVAPVLWSQIDEADHPREAVRRIMNRTLVPFALHMRPETCSMVRTHMRLTGLKADDPRSRGELAYWFCPLGPGVDATAPEAPLETPYDDVFQRMEAACPRLFPPGSGQLRRAGALHLRHYTSTDIGVMVVEGEGVAFKYFRALNPTFVGSIDDVRSGRAVPDCERVPGRYVPPWQRG